MTVPNAGSDRGGARRAGEWVGIGLQIAVGVFPYGASGLIVPPAGLVLLFLPPSTGPPKSGQVRERRQDPVDVIVAVVVHESDAHGAAPVQQAEHAHGLDGVVVA